MIAETSSSKNEADRIIQFQENVNISFTIKFLRISHNHVTLLWICFLLLKVETTLGAYKCKIFPRVHFVSETPQSEKRTNERTTLYEQPIDCRSIKRTKERTNQRTNEWMNRAAFCF